MTARHCELDPELRLFAQNRIEKLAKFARDIMEVHLVVSAEKYRHSAEITLRLKGREIVSREQAIDAKAAVDLAADRLEQQMRRFKEKRIERKRGARPVGDGLAPPPTGVEEEAYDADYGAASEE
jgi:putative sigma-54 modulation protein